MLMPRAAWYLYSAWHSTTNPLRTATGYLRFATAAEAIRFAVEELPITKTLGAWMQVGDDRFDSDEIGRL